MHFVVFSHLRWNFVYQRPQHLLTRAAAQNPVWFWEEPMFEDGEPELLASSKDNVTVIVPKLPTGLQPAEIHALEQELLDELISENKISDFVVWYYTPMAMEFTRHLQPRATVYDSMDELSAFRGAPPGLKKAEADNEAY